MNRERLILVVLIIVTCLALFPKTASSAFDLSKHSIPVDEIRSGGPAKDAIPSLTNPVFVSKERATFMEDVDIVLGVEIEGMAKAYPVKILNWHEAVNDRLGGTNILATW